MSLLSLDYKPEKSTQPIAPLDLLPAHPTGVRLTVRCRQVESAVWTLPVVVLHELFEHTR
jgi:hypothetical protein